MNHSSEPVSYQPALAVALFSFFLLQAASRADARDLAEPDGQLPEAAEFRESGAFGEGPSDSLAFALKRRKILEGAPDVRLSAILEAAEDLAEDGYYAEALELVYDLEDTAWSAKSEGDFLMDSLPSGTAAAPEAVPEPARPAAPAPARLVLKELHSYVRSSFEYDDWDDQPFGGEVRAKLEWLPEDSFLERVTPTFAGSDRRAFAGLATRGSAFGRLLKVDAEGLAERKLWQAYGDSLDRISLLGLVEAGTRPLGRPVSVSLPIRGEADLYREDRLGLLSRRSVGAAPALEAVSRDLRRSLLVSWDVRWYEFPASPASGFFRHGPSLLANWFGDRFTVETEAHLLDDRYDRDTSMYRSRVWEGRISAFAKPGRRVQAGLRLLHGSETSRYLDTLRMLGAGPTDSVPLPVEDPVRVRYRLEGVTAAVQPVVTVDWRSIYSASLSLAYSRGWYPLLSGHGGRDLAWPQFIDESYQGWKPEATFSILSRRLFLNVTLGYEMHAPSASPFYFQGYSEGVGLGGHCSWKLSPWMEMDLSGLWRKRLDGKPAPGQVQDMTSISGGFISRFQ